jgi:hypothetical protein
MSQEATAFHSSLIAFLLGCVYGELGAPPGFRAAEQGRCVLDAYFF